MKEKFKKILKLDYDKKMLELLKAFMVIGSMYVIPQLFQEAILSLDIIKSKPIVGVISNFLYLLVLFAFYHKSIIKEFKIFKGDLKTNVKTGFRYWFIGLGLMMISNLIINLIIFSGDIATNEQLNREILSKYPLYSIISAVLIAPFIEEVIFRKSFKNAIDNKMIYFMVSGVFFGLAHALTQIDSLLNLLYIIPYGALGYVFAMSYEKTKTIFTPILIHTFHNAITIALLIAFNSFL